MFGITKDGGSGLTCAPLGKISSQQALIERFEFED